MVEREISTSGEREETGEREKKERKKKDAWFYLEMRRKYHLQLVMYANLLNIFLIMLFYQFF